MMRTEGQRYSSRHGKVTLIIESAFCWVWIRINVLGKYVNVITIWLTWLKAASAFEWGSFKRDSEKWLKLRWDNAKESKSSKETQQCRRVITGIMFLTLSSTKWYILMFKPKCYLQRQQFANVLDKAILAITWNAVLLLAEMFIITHLKFEL